MNKLVLILALALPAVAQQQPQPEQTCPVTVTKVGTAFNNSGDHIKWHFENTSGKVVAGVKFDMVMLDAVLDPHGSIYTFASKHKLKPGAKWWEIYDLISERGEADRGAVVTTRKVLFEDGSTWENPDKECSTKGTW